MNKMWKPKNRKKEKKITDLYVLAGVNIFPVALCSLITSIKQKYV